MYVTQQLSMNCLSDYRSETISCPLNVDEASLDGQAAVMLTKVRFSNLGTESRLSGLPNFAAVPERQK